MKCPHCLNGFHSRKEYESLATDIDTFWFVRYETCPECKKIIIYLYSQIDDKHPEIERLVYPKGISRAPVSKEVNDKEILEDYKEACLVLADSPKASAALSRRCVQNLLREKAGVKKVTLADEIQQVLDSKQLPSYLSESLDAIRNIGKFAAHPIKSKISGEIVDVEDGEAEWNLDVLEGLFDFYYVQPAILKKKREELNKKLTDAGKPPMK